MARTGVDMERPPNLPATHYIDNRIYSDPTIFEEERDKIFGKIWNLVCHESEVTNVYDFRTLEVAGTPIVVTHGCDGQIRSFLNACSHRGAKVVRALSGNESSFICPFHLWSYDTLGACISVTRRRGLRRHRL